jgi:hypothetical protein
MELLLNLEVCPSGPPRKACGKFKFGIHYVTSGGIDASPNIVIHV